MHRYLYIALLAFSPLLASAHAFPVQTEPDSSAILTHAPAEVVLHFSEHVDEKASSIIVTGPSGKTVSAGVAHITQGDGRVLSVATNSDGVGTYLVSWSAISADDGHFTKGAYPFAVGKNQIVSQVNSSGVEVVEVNNAPEADFSAMELIGDGIIWAVLLLFIFCTRPLLHMPRWENERRTLEHFYRKLLYAGLWLAFFGGFFQLIIKAGEFSNLEAMKYGAAFTLYSGTVAGLATLYRMAAVVGVFVLFIFYKKKIFNSPAVTWVEGVMVVLMCVFAYWRALISHVTANPFHTDFSIAVNFLQVIEKDIWFGILLFLVALSISSRTRGFLMELLPKAFVLLGINFAMISLTASYLVWLHLKSFDNLFTLEWGGVFLQLLTAAVLVVCFRTYHVLARLRRKELFAKYLPLTLAAELACALLVVYFSALATITPPPFQQPETAVYSATDQGLTLTLEKDVNEDGMVLLTEHGGKAPLPAPTLTLEDTNGTAGAQSIELTKLWDGGYVFPELFMSGKGPFQVEIVAPQTGGYDAHASFTVPKGAFDPGPGWQNVRTFDFFTSIMLLIGFAACAYALLLLSLSTRESTAVLVMGRYSVGQATMGFVLMFCVGLVVTVGVAATGITNPYKAQCENDGNLWHLMLPTKAGVPLTQQPTEGCMWGMGNYMYMFPDSREYDYVRSMDAASVQLVTTPAQLVAGVPTKLNVSLENSDGTPATLFYDMDKLLHMVIISKDETVFAHIHADDKVSLTDAEIKNSSYDFSYTFPKAGEYLVSVDYAHGLMLESKQFKVVVGGAPAQNTEAKQYGSTGKFGGYDVSLKYFVPLAGQVTTLQYTITKNGVPVTNLKQYLSAAMHVSVVNNDFSWFLHVHGEVHPPGVPLPPIIIKNGQVLHTMAMMMNVPTQFGPNVEAHLIFPTEGIYTVWGEFQVNGVVVPTAFTIKVE